ncbi:MAG TPA: hypothetical protein VM286_09250 [Candidatus Thermoplasmatota archaeon]|nr:hypothetical protein [Candidatus Thermoplasmatota archaeon]
MKSLLAVLVVASFVLVLAPVQANHVQAEGGKTIVFDHKPGGNEYWVEVVLSGSSAASVARVDAMDYGGPWVAMKKTSYGSWSASFHIESGNPVKFRATWADGVQVSSCWFSHPQGVESCGGSPPPPPPSSGVWQSGGTFATVVEGIYDMGTGDADRDGKAELYGVGREGLFRFWTVGLTNAQVEHISSSMPFSNIAVGDGDRDGKPDVYANGYNVATNQMEMHQFTRVNGAWVDKVIATGARVSGPFMLGDIDRTGTRELYVTGSDGVDTTASKLWFANGVWNLGPLARFHADTSYNISPGEIWGGDADADGQNELVVASYGKPGQFVYMVDYTGSAWVATEVWAGTVDAVVAGNVDNEGSGEIALLSDYDLVVIKRINGAWVSSVVMSLPTYGYDLFLADGDNDGTQELYVLLADHHVYQVRKVASAWQKTDMGDTPSFDEAGYRLIVGDATGDGKREVIASTFDIDMRYGHLTMFSWVPSGSPPPPPPPPTGFDATFSGVKGNEYWVQASVSGTETIAGVDARVNCSGSWIPLAKQSYGWSKSIHVLNGQKVDFRAHGSSGATDLSGGYIWPNATPTSAC